MRKIAYGMIVAGSMLTQESLAMDNSDWISNDLREIFQQCEAASNAKEIPGILNKYTHIKESLCKEIKDERFYAAAALFPKCGTIKNRAMVTWCEGVEFEREDKKTVGQNPKIEDGKKELNLRRVVREQKELEKEEPPAFSLENVKEKVPSIPTPTEFQRIKLRHVKLGEKARTVETEQSQLQEASEANKANLAQVKSQLAEALKLENNAQREEVIKEKQRKVIALQEQLIQAESSIKKAQDYYDNLGAMIIGMREDLNAVRNELKVFKPSEHEKDTPEAYLEAAKDLLPQENTNGFTIDLKRTFPQFLQQLPIASEILEQSQKSLAEARLDLVRINRELVELTQ